MFFYKNMNRTKVIYSQLLERISVGMLIYMDTLCRYVLIGSSSLGARRAIYLNKAEL